MHLAGGLESTGMTVFLNHPKEWIKKPLTFVLLTCYNYSLGCIMGNRVNNSNARFTGGLQLLLTYFQISKGFDKVCV